MLAVKSAIVTGCSRGIGRAVTEMLLADGWEVLGISRTMPKNPTGWNYGNFSWFEWDLGQDPADYVPPPPGYMTGPSEGYHPSNILRDVQGEYDALIHCAAVQGPVGPLLDCDPDEWAQAVRTNLIGTYNIVRAALPSLQRSDDARILLFSGGGAFNPRPDYTSYAASKAGVVSFMESLSDELRHTSVSVNAVAPGYVPTSIHNAPVKDDGGEAMREAVACVRHLLSPATRGLSGKTISAPFDDWRGIVGTNAVARVNASVMGTRTRHPVAMVQRVKAVV